MTWAAPRTWVAGETATAALLNQHARDNMKALVPQADAVATSQSTTSTSYTDLATVGPTVTVDTFTSAYIIWGAFITGTVATQYYLMSYEVSGATTIAASDNWHHLHRLEASTFHLRGSKLHQRTDLTPGSNVFKAKYRAGSGTGTWAARTLVVIPVGPAS